MIQQVTDLASISSSASEKLSPLSWLSANSQLGTDSEPSVASRPQVQMPGGSMGVSDTARELGELLDANGHYFCRGGVLTAMHHDEKGAPTLEIVKPAKFVTTVEKVCQPVKPARAGNTSEPTVLGKTMAESILNADDLLDRLPPIKAITRCPILLERNGKLVQVVKYDRETGIYATGKPVEEVSLQEAKEILAALLHGFRFASPSDKSRAFAALITPGLVLGGLLPKRAPATLLEADQSQAGKGYFVRIAAAVYADKSASVVQSKGGVVRPIRVLGLRNRRWLAET